MSDIMNGERGFFLHASDTEGDINPGEFVYAGDVNNDGIEDFLASGHNELANDGITYVVFGLAFRLLLFVIICILVLYKACY